MGLLAKRELEAYVGDYSQVMGIEECVLQGGKAKGIRACRIRNGCGLDLTVLADKCMNIPYLTFKGHNIGFLNKTGICAGEYYQENGAKGFLRNFEAGFLTTCGLTYMGAACEDEGQALGLHGPMSNTPAEHVCGRMEWREDVAHFHMCGEMREASLFDEYLVLTRNLELNSAVNSLEIHDRIENRGFESQPLMLLYHFNFGYPMLSEQTKIYSNLNQITPRDGYSAEFLSECGNFGPPVPGKPEQVFFRTGCTDTVRQGLAVIHNEALGIAAVLTFRTEQLPVLNQWKSERSGDYGLGIEPGTCHVGGRSRVRKEGTLPMIEAGETRSFDLTMDFLDDAEEIHTAIKKTML